MQYQYEPTGTCSQLIQIEVTTDGVIERVGFLGGCEGNLLGISQLVKGRPIDEVIATLRGIDCRGKGTSCPDQLAAALLAAKTELAGG